ncbi:MAG: hypothetical protein Q7S90_09200, partial [Rubrivivax sp.]|nr:hypothetical protein [Rubrivivax sp.]
CRGRALHFRGAALKAAANPVNMTPPLEDPPMPLPPAPVRNDSPPWWRLPNVWMVIGGPLVVVVASFATLTLALRNPDPLISAPSGSKASELPAVQGRNHAATPRP